jgi:hypothetical protein
MSRFSVAPGVRANVAGSCETRQSGSPPGVSSFFELFEFFCGHSWLAPLRPRKRGSAPHSERFQLRDIRDTFLGECDPH